MPYRAVPMDRLGVALGLGYRHVVAFTGGGGKTSAMFCLARELKGERRLVTTTTRIWAPRPDEAELVLADNPDEAQARLSEHWRAGIRALGTAVTSDGKLQGIPPEWVASLSKVADRVLVEADGAAGKPLTVPREYEPVIPPCTELLVPVCGLDALGAPIDAEHVHRAPEMAERLGKRRGDRLTPRDVAAIMLSPWGNVKGAPPETEIVPLVNKVDLIPDRDGRTWPHLSVAEDPGRDYDRAVDLATTLSVFGVSRVVLATFRTDPPRFIGMWVQSGGCQGSDERGL